VVYPFRIIIIIIIIIFLYYIILYFFFVRFLALPHFLRSRGSGTGPTHPREDN
jgi:hypothetical protein